MADNTTLNTMTGGDVISTDDIGGGIKVQRFKVQYGADGSATDVSSSAPLPVADAGSSAATLANVTAAVVSTTLATANASRRGLVLHNDSSSAMWLKYGSAASNTSYTYPLAAGDVWEMPRPIYTGTVAGIWTTATGTARVTEF